MQKSNLIVQDNLIVQEKTLKNTLPYSSSRKRSNNN